MAFTEDGTGSGKLARVDGNNRLHTRAVTLGEEEEANKDGRAYNVNTGVITLTTANDSAVLYLKNNEEQPLHVSAIAVGLGPTTGGSGGIPKITVIRGPTGGTIVSGATAVDIKSNRNYGSADTLTADAYKGDGTAMTLSGGEDHLIFFQTASGRLFATIDEILPKGSTIGVKIDPQAGNTSMDCYAALICHLEDPDE